MSTFQPNRPTRYKMLFRGFTGRCAVCGVNRLTTKWLTLESRCPRCDLPLDRREGEFIGAVGMNTIVTFGSILITVLVGAALTAPEIPVGRLSVITVLVGLGMSVLFFPISKTLWSAIDVMTDPPRPGEVDPRYDPSVDLSS